VSKNFDLDLKFGLLFEDKVQKMLNCKGNVEVKTERDKWLKTGNICIEVKYRDKPSGLAATDADTWIHLLAINDEIVGGFFFPVDKLKLTVKRLLIQGKAKKLKAGDSNLSEIVLLPIKDIFDYAT
tara:strand:- start:1039 stop:1416 length:378 start_codon:yes stop_codon:yes gene_type:complete